jgi:catechol 2,3-dioxygenase-like lactoylglutathione lyase family enzyme
MFYQEALGLPVLERFEGHAGYSGVMLAIPGTQVHLEFTHADEGSPCPAPTRDNLLVLYFADHSSYLSALQRMEARGHSPVEPENPYWVDKSYTFEDPDGWRVVLYDGPAFE